jgi:hypothetical protein
MAENPQPKNFEKVINNSICTSHNMTRMTMYTEQSTRKATSGKECLPPSRSMCDSFGPEGLVGTRAFDMAALT